MVCSFRTRRTSEIIISYLFMKNSAKPTCGTIPAPNIMLDPLPASFRVARRIDQLHNRARRIPFRRCLFASLRTSAFLSGGKKRRSVHNHACLRSLGEEAFSSFVEEKIASRYNNCAWNSSGVLTRHRNDIHGCHWQMKQGACPLSQLQTREVKLH